MGFAMATEVNDNARRIKDEKLRANAERHRLLALATRDPVWEIDFTTGQVSWNEAYDNVFGIRPEETHDSWDWWTSRIHEDDRERVAASLASTIEDPTACLLYTSPSPRDATLSRMPSSA